MGQRRKPGVTRESAAQREMRDQEVLRANRELAAYFKGRRTEREARAALKIIKAFVRDRERKEESGRAPLPGADDAKTPQHAANRKAAIDSGERPRRKVRRRLRTPSSTSATAAIEPEENADLPRSPDSDDRTSE